MAQDLYSDDVGNTAAFLLSPLARAITGVTLYVDNGYYYYCCYYYFLKIILDIVVIVVTL